MFIKNFKEIKASSYNCVDKKKSIPCLYVDI